MNKLSLNAGMDRRHFLKVTSGTTAGLSLGFFVPERASAANAPQLNVWVEIEPNDTIVIRYARAEMGQGSMTSAPMIIAEELDADWKKVRVEYATAHENLRTKRAYGDMASVGSRTIRNSQEYLRKAGATARHMLVAAAAQQWGVPAAECKAALSKVSHAPSKRSLSYGQLAQAAAQLEAPKEVTLKDPKDWVLIGKPIARVDIPDIVAGRIRYGIDTQLPGMLHAAVAACPVFNGKVKSMDASKVENRRGIVKVLNLGEFVAVVADNWWRAKEALREVVVDWAVGEHGTLSSAAILAHFKAGLEIYQDNCAACHGSDGKGENALFPPLTGSPIIAQTSAETLVRVVLAGTQSAQTKGNLTSPAMPSFAWRLNDAQVADVLSYVRGSWGNGGAVSAGAVADQRKSIPRH